MSTFRCMYRWNKGISLAPLSLLGGILLILQCAFSSVAFASANRSVDLGNSEAFDRASVSVVRLVVNYSSSSVTPVPSSTSGVGGASAPGVQCTGLGVLVKSWTATSLPSAEEQNNWVLTDGALVDPNAAMCASGLPKASLSSIDVYPNMIYTGTSLNPGLLGTFTPSTASHPSKLIPQGVRSGDSAALFSFHTDANRTLPYLDPVNGDKTPQFGIELQNAAGSVPQQGLLPQGEFFLNPARTGISDLSLEPGTPLINSQGQLVGMRLTKNPAFSAETIVSFLGGRPELKDPPLPQPRHQNTVHDEWNQAVTDYYAHDYTAVQQDFPRTSLANPQFQAASTLRNKAQAQLAGAGEQASGGKNTSAGGSIYVAGVPIPYWELGLMALILVVGLLVLVSILFGRSRVRRRELKKFEVERIAAEERATEDAKRLTEEEARHKQPQAPAQSVPQEQVTAPLLNGSNGEHAVPAAQQEATPVPPAVPLAAEVSPLQPIDLISDQPTLDMTPNPSNNGDIDQEKTIPFEVLQREARNISFAVGTRSDRGIKRKYKPNEDSIFAAQGVRKSSVQPSQFGLFVVADGMGGHANGQDASRLAIQTIVNCILPRLSESDETDEKALTTLLVNGVQAANGAVHERNMEHGADMGTTMTATLIVGAAAHIANVGDSRTYLYRPPEGLRKITHDHSVVASLVEAGIIQPDDVYSHPKRSQIYRSLGEKSEVEIDSFTVQLQPGDKLLLCSDGLWEMVRDPEIQRILSTDIPDMEQTGEELIQAALKGGGEDNISAVVIHITETDGRPTMSGIQLIDKPETVQMPQV